MNVKEKVLGAVIGTGILLLMTTVPIIKEDAILLASVGSTVYSVFLMPKKGKVAHVLKSYAIASFVGLVTLLLPVVYYEKVFLSVLAIMLAMALFDANHPPAVGIGISAMLAGDYYRSLSAVLAALGVMLAVFAAVKLAIATVGKKRHYVARYFAKVGREIGV